MPLQCTKVHFFIGTFLFLEKHSVVNVLTQYPTFYQHAIMILTVNSIWGGGTNLPNRKKNVKKNGKCNQNDFLLVFLKSLSTTFKTIFGALSARGVCHVTIIGGVVYKEYMIFKVF